MWYVCDVLYAVLYVRVSCFVVCGCGVSRRYIDVCYCMTISSRGVVASAPDFERADEGSILTAGLCFKSGKSECYNSGYKLTGLTWWP